jgi:hypothetical protein
MRRVFIIAAIAEACIIALVLHGEVKDFFYAHPWWQSFVAALPGIAVPVLAWFELRHSGEANVLRAEANDFRAEANSQRLRANALQEEQNKSVAEIARLQAEIARLTKELDTERNKHLQQIASNTQRRKGEAEINGEALRKYIGQRAFVNEGDGYWGGGAVIAEVNDNNIVTLFVPASFNNSQAYGQAVRCDRLHIVEEPTGGCAVQISIIERYGKPTFYGEARSWAERNVKPAHAGMTRGANVFNAQYRKDGSPKLRHIYIYDAAEGSPNFTMAAIEDLKETDSWQGSQADIENKFAIVQLEWVRQGYHWAGGGGSGKLNLFVRK